MTGFRLAPRRRAGALRHHAPTSPASARSSAAACRWPCTAAARRSWTQRVAPLGPVYQAGTLGGNPLAMAAGLRDARRTRPERLRAPRSARERVCKSGLVRAIADARVAGVVQRVGSMITLFFPTGPVSELRDASQSDTKRFAPLLPRHARARRLLAALAVRGRLHLARAHRRDIDETVAARPSASSARARLDVRPGAPGDRLHPADPVVGEKGWTGRIRKRAQVPLTLGVHQDLAAQSSSGSRSFSRSGSMRQRSAIAALLPLLVGQRARQRGLAVVRIAVPASRRRAHGPAHGRARPAASPCAARTSSARNEVHAPAPTTAAHPGRVTSVPRSRQLVPRPARFGPQVMSCRSTTPSPFTTTSRI